MASASVPVDSKGGEEAQVTPFGQGSKRSLPMRVVVCGLGRTGTASMKTALEILGYPTYHAFNFWLDSQENMEAWNRAMDAKYQGRGTFTRLDWDGILGNSMASVDAPSAFFAPEIALAYPGAKVIILTREPEAWFRSCQAALSYPLPWWLLALMKVLNYWDARQKAFMTHMLRKQAEIWRFQWHEPGAHDKALAFYHDYYAECRRRIPEERRIEFKVQDGWAPLCAHLGVEVPTVEVDGKRVELPFPRTNEAAEFRAKLGKLRAGIIKGALMMWFNKLLLFGTVGYAMYSMLGGYVSNAPRLW